MQKTVDENGVALYSCYGTTILSRKWLPPYIGWLEDTKTAGHIALHNSDHIFRMLYTGRKFPCSSSSPFIMISRHESETQCPLQCVDNAPWIQHTRYHLKTVSCILLNTSCTDEGSISYLTPSPPYCTKRYSLEDIGGGKRSHSSTRS